MKKYFATFVMMCMGICGADAIPVTPGATAWWGGGSRTGATTADSFIIAGTLGKGGTHGTWGDEWAVVGVMAQYIVPHGGYFCPYQIQCANKRKKKTSWTLYYQPTGFSLDKCAWLCEDGYAGQNCLERTSTPARCDTAQLSPNAGGKFSGVSLKTYGQDSGGVEYNLTSLDTWYNPGSRECDTLLGITKFLEHGVVASPVILCCSYDNYKSMDSWVDLVHIPTDSKPKVLCASGYQANADGTDCVPINADMCATQDMNFCDGFDRSKFDSSIHTLTDASGGCVKYFCSEIGTAFPAIGDTTCAPCGTGSKGGSNPNNGVCIVCQTGQIFDSETGTCKSAAAYSKSDLQYGKAQTKNSISVDKQCWTLTTPEEYTVCVPNGGARQAASTGSSGAAARVARQPIRR